MRYLRFYPPRNLWEINWIRNYSSVFFFFCKYWGVESKHIITWNGSITCFTEIGTRVCDLDSSCISVATQRDLRLDLDLYSKNCGLIRTCDLANWLPFPLSWFRSKPPQMMTYSIYKRFPTQACSDLFAEIQLILLCSGRHIWLEKM